MISAPAKIPDQILSKPSGPAFAHIFLTRFNIRFEEDPLAPAIGVDPDWLADRFELFERYCFPSVLAQSEQNFSWIIFFDSTTPEPFAERARQLASRRPQTYPVFCESTHMGVVEQAVREALLEPPQWLLTTRLDNDDGLHRDFVATVQESQTFEGAEGLNCPVGIILAGDRTYRRRDDSNAFLSLSEPFEGFQTIFVTQHRYASELFPVRQLNKAPLWLQVIHSNNISNRVRGWRVPFASVQGFLGLGTRSATRGRESPGSILIENLSLFVVRSLLDLAAIVARRAARLVGHELRRKPVRRGV